MAESGRRFWKMTGSGNDFVFFDARVDPPGILQTPHAIGALCDRRRGVGADGVVFLERVPGRAFGIRYFNRDGSLAELCGNASLCAVMLAKQLGITDGLEEFSFETTSGPLTGRVDGAGPEIESTPVADAVVDFDTRKEGGERRVGYARVGVPHLVVLCDDVNQIDVVGRGRPLRHLPSLPRGANVNFVSGGRGEWAMRTYERGVEEETLACGTGSVATAAMLLAWHLDESPVPITTRSGEPVLVRFPPQGSPGSPRLRGEGRLVFEGTIADVPGLSAV